MNNKNVGKNLYVADLGNMIFRKIDALSSQDNYPI